MKQNTDFGSIASITKVPKSRKILKTQQSEESLSKRGSSQKKKKVKLRSQESITKNEVEAEETNSTNVKGDSPQGSIKGSDIGSPQMRRSRTKLR